jgi:xanthine dehydrogenase accessory factor
MRKCRKNEITEVHEAVRTLYRELIRTLNDGEEAVLITRCAAAGVSKTLRLADGDAGDGQESVRRSGEGQENEIVVTEYFAPKPRMIVFGGGHIAVPLSAMASLLKFDVVIFDDRPSFANRARFPSAREVICDGFGKAGERLNIRKNDYVVIATRGHRHDEECLRDVLSGCFPRYAGMVGSRRRMAVMRRQLAEEGFSRDSLERLHAPVGLPIGAATPEEIALSILAEVVQEKRKNWPNAGQKRLYADVEPMEWLARRENDDKKAALATVIAAKGPTPRGAGAKMAALADGIAVGSIGGGCAEADVLRDARDVIRNGGCLFKTVDMTDTAEDDGMMCGGTMDVMIEAV